MGFSGPSPNLPPPPPAFSFAKGMSPAFQTVLFPLEEITTMAGLGGSKGASAPPAANAAAAYAPISADASPRRGMARYGGAGMQPTETTGAASSTGLKQLTGQ